MSKSNGWTLIELTIVIVVLSILMAIAIPKFSDLRAYAYAAVTKGYAGSMGSEVMVNTSGCYVTTNVVTPGMCVKVAKCSDIASSVIGLPVLVAAGAPVVGAYNLAVDNTVTNGSVAQCVLQYGISPGVFVTGTYNVIGAGN